MGSDSRYATKIQADAADKEYVDPCSTTGCMKGRGAWGCVFFPIVLLWQSVNIYFIPCVGIYLNRLATVGEKGLCCLCVLFGCWRFKDTEFVGDAALGDPVKYRDVEWVRAREICKGLEPGKNPKLFAGKIEPADLRQGHLGDCWLLAALATLAEHPVAIRKCFLNREYSSRGKYRVRLYDGLKRQWVIIVIDDYIPVKKGTKDPIFVKPNGEELWAMLLEKAFAKFYGSYAKLSGGQEIGALFQITGDNCFSFRSVPETKKDDGYWKHHWVRHDPKFMFEERDWVSFERSDEEIKDDRFFRIMLQYNHKHSVMTAAFMYNYAKSDPELQAACEDRADRWGLVPSHAYSVLEVRRAGTSLGMGGVRLVKLRNPWGSYEWKGKWSDGSKEWTENPEIAKEVGYVDDSSDGAFWMSFDDFQDFFREVQVCDRTTVEDLRLDVVEDSAICGPTIGCVGGCIGFWCCCMGARTIYCGNVTKAETEKAAGCCTTV